MRSAPFSPAVKRLILIGGGHSHLAVLKALAMRPVPGLETILITREVWTPYSGAMPAHLAGRLSAEDMHIDLRPLARFAGVRLIQAEVTRVDLERKRVHLDNRPALGFDALSLNIGSRPDAGRLPGAQEYAIAVKPIDRFLMDWEAVRQRAVATLESGADFHLAIVGGGPASVELAFATRERVARDAPRATGKLRLSVVTADADVLANHATAVRARVMARLRAQHIDVVGGRRVSGFAPGQVLCGEDPPLAADAIVYATGASIPDWPATCGLQTDPRGFIAVDTQLQSLSHPFVFAAGDAASIAGHPRPKSGVYAVRQGPVLARNLVRYLTGQRLTQYRPQRHALALLYAGSGFAIASRDTWAFEGRWVWWWKQRIDRRFLERFRDFPPPRAELAIAPGLIDHASADALRAHALRCSGCGAKVGAGALSDVLADLPRFFQADVLRDSGVEDASRIQLPDGPQLVQSVDFLPAPIDDPWLFGRILVNHCLNDLYAMGCMPHSALAIVGIPFARAALMHSTFDELMQGMASELVRHETQLIGGHSTETTPLSAGLSVNGFTEGPVLSKSAVQPGDRLILTKALGSGVLLAADMRFAAHSEWIRVAIDAMLTPQRDAARILRAAGAHACTDITGFGLAGHLQEMLSPTQAGVELNLDAVPALPGALTCLQNGIRSSLHAENQTAATALSLPKAKRQDARIELLFDPQTAGGLLAAVPATTAAGCVAELRAAGYGDAVEIGEITAVGGDTEIQIQHGRS